MKAAEFKALPNWEKVRNLSGVIVQTGDPVTDNHQLINRLALVCLISRVEVGDADKDFLDSQIDKAFEQ